MAARWWVGLAGVWLVACATTVGHAGEVDATLAAARRALGGEELLARVRGVDARVHGSGPSGEYVLELELPCDRPWRFRWLFPGRAERLVEVDGWEGWVVEGAVRTPLSPAEVVMVRTHAFPWLAWWPEWFFVGVEGDGPLRLRMVDGVGEEAHAEFECGSDRLVRLEVVDTSSEPAADVRIEFEEWQEVEGVVLPRRVVAHDPSGEWVMELGEVVVRFGEGE